MAGLRAIQARLPDTIGEVRGKGLMIGIELVSDGVHRIPARDLTDRLLDRAFRNGLLLLSCGLSTIRLMPPLIIDRAAADEALELFERSLRAVLNESSTC
jgi:4-aminobutyrate aminotransferase